MTKLSLAVAAVFAAGTALGQQPQPYPPPQQPSSQQPSSQSTAGSQGESSSAQPSSPGASSQQVVVNPPPSEQPSTQPPPAPPSSSTTVVNPPSSPYDPVVVERREERNPMATVAADAAYGGIAGLLVGVGVALVNEWDSWERDVMIGAGAGVLVGAAVGVAHAAYDAREDRRSRRVALDGLNRTDRDPVVTARTPLKLAFRF